MGGGISIPSPPHGGRVHTVLDTVAMGQSDKDNKLGLGDPEIFYHIMPRSYNHIIPGLGDRSERPREQYLLKIYLRKT